MNNNNDNNNNKKKKKKEGEEEEEKENKYLGRNLWKILESILKMDKGRTQRNRPTEEEFDDSEKICTAEKYQRLYMSEKGWV